MKLFKARLRKFELVANRFVTIIATIIIVNEVFKDQRTNDLQYPFVILRTNDQSAIVTLNVIAEFFFKQFGNSLRNEFGVWNDLIFSLSYNINQLIRPLCVFHVCFFHFCHICIMLKNKAHIFFFIFFIKLNCLV